MAQFIFGGDTGETPESIAAKRAIIQALVNRVAGPTPRTLGGGLGMLGNAIAARRYGKRADEAQEAGRASAAADFAPLFAALGMAPSQTPAPVAPETLPGPTTSGPVEMPSDYRPVMSPPIARPGMADAARGIREPLGGGMTPPMTPRDPKMAGVALPSLSALGQAERTLGRELQINSGMRTPDHNAEVGGATASRHLPEMGASALDISLAGMPDADRSNIVAAMKAAGFTAGGGYADSAHFDMGPARTWGPSRRTGDEPAYFRAGWNGTAAPTSAAPAAAPAGGAGPSAGVDPRLLMKALANPWLMHEPGKAAVVQALFQQYMSQNAGLTQWQQAQLDLDREKFDWQRSQPTAGTAKEQQIARLVSTGMDRNTAVMIADGAYAVSRDPLTGNAQVVDKASGRVVGAAPPEAAEDAAGAGQPGPGLYGQAEQATGVIPAIKEAATGIFGQIPGMEGMTFPETVEIRQNYAVALNDLIRSLSVNPRYPVGEMKRLREEANIEPNVWQSGTSLQSRMKSIDNYLRGKLESETAISRDPNATKEQKQQAAQSISAITRFLGQMGVPQANDRGDDGAPIPQSAINDGVTPDIWKHMTEEERALWLN